MESEKSFGLATLLLSNIMVCSLTFLWIVGLENEVWRYAIALSMPIAIFNLLFHGNGSEWTLLVGGIQIQL